jgi:hypothetical protein
MRRRRKSDKKRSCRYCGLRGPHGECRDKALKSGRCGDWVWYMIGSKQYRRRHARPEDPRTLAQLLNRGRLTAASKLYSQALTDQQRDAVIAAGAKKRCRSRMGDSGVMTGHQHWVHKEALRRKAQSKATKTQFASQVPPPQPLPRPTSDTHRILTGNTRATHAATTRHPTKPPQGQKPVKGRLKKAVPLMELKQIQTLTRSTGTRNQAPTRTTTSRPAHRSRSLPVKRQPAMRKPAAGTLKKLRTVPQPA